MRSKFAHLKAALFQVAENSFNVLSRTYAAISSPVSANKSCGVSAFSEPRLYELNKLYGMPGCQGSQDLETWRLTPAMHNELTATLWRAISSFYTLERDLSWAHFHHPIIRISYCLALKIFIFKFGWPWGPFPRVIHRPEYEKQWLRAILSSHCFSTSASNGHTPLVSC